MLLLKKNMENVRKHKDIKLVITEKRNNYWVSEPNYHTTKIFTKKNMNLMIVDLWLSTLKLSKVLLHEFLYDYVKPKYDEKANLCYMDTDSFIAYIKTNI